MNNKPRGAIKVKAEALNGLLQEAQWQNAILALTASPPDPKPLAALWRSPNPIPAGIRDTLAELLDPGEPEYLGARLRLVQTGETEKNLRRLASITGRNRVEERTLFRYKAQWRKLQRRLRGD